MNLSAVYWKGEMSSLMQKCKVLLQTLGLRNSRDWGMNSPTAYYTYNDNLVMYDIGSIAARETEETRSFITTEVLYETLKAAAIERGFDVWWLDLKEGDTVTLNDWIVGRNKFLEKLYGKELTIAKIIYCNFEPDSGDARSEKFNGDYSHYYLSGIPTARFTSFCFNPINSTPLAKLDLEDFPFIKELEP